MDFVRRTQILRLRAGEHAHLFWVSLCTFVIIYASSFVTAYGYFIDEFYYLACASHPAFGYVDHPPLAPFILTVFQSACGTSLLAIRVLPALAQSAAVFLTGLLAKEIGGGKFAQFLSASAMAGSPTVIALGAFYSMNAFEPLLAAAVMYYAIRMIKENDPKRWILLGVLMGLGVMNKHTFGLFIVALTGSFFLAGKWRLMLNRWFVFGGMCGLVVFLPNVLWQAANDFPSLEFYRNISASKNVPTPPVAFLLGQVLGMSPATVPIWCAGMVYLLVAKPTREFRFLSILFLGLLAFMMISGTSRSDRLLFAYPGVMAGGALLWDGVIARYKARWARGVIVGLLLAGLALAVPLILPSFSPASVQSYVQWTGFNTEIERGKKPPIPQLLADRIGWEEKCDLVVRAFERLSPGDRSSTIVVAGNYGQAGALELFGKKHGVPPVVCTHNNYYLWSRERLQGSIILTLEHADAYGRLKERFDVVEPCEGEFSSPYVSAHENNLKVFLCRGARMPLAEMLRQGKNYH